MTSGKVIFEERKFKINEHKSSLQWKESGFHMEVSEGTIDPGEEYEFHVCSLVHGEFIFPPGSELISAIYDIRITKKLLKPMVVAIQHCYSVEDEMDEKLLSFVVCKPSVTEIENTQYHFKRCEGGIFPINDEYGYIKANDFSFLGIVEVTDYSSDVAESQASNNDQSTAQSTQGLYVTIAKNYDV